MKQVTCARPPSWEEADSRFKLKHGYPQHTHTAARPPPSAFLKKKNQNKKKTKCLLIVFVGRDRKRIRNETPGKKMNFKLLSSQDTHSEQLSPSL